MWCSGYLFVDLEFGDLFTTCLGLGFVICV